MESNTARRKPKVRKMALVPWIASALIIGDLMYIFGPAPVAIGIIGVLGIIFWAVNYEPD